MALRYHDSYDHYATADMAKKGYAFVSGTVPPAVSSGNGRNGTASLRINPTFTGPNNVTVAPSGISGATAIVGVGFRIDGSLPGGLVGIVAVLDGGTVHGVLAVNATGNLVYYRGEASATLGTSTSTITGSTYYFVELKVLLSDTVGTVDVRVDGVSYLSLTSQDTIQSGSATWRGVRLGQNRSDWASNYISDYDDLYICDGSGASHTTFLGDYRSFVRLPSTGNGTHAEWAPSTGTDHGALVDAATPNITDYVSSSTAGHRDTFNYAALGVSGTVGAVTQPVYAKADAAGIRQLVAICVIGGTTYTHATAQTLGSDWLYYRFTWLVSPATAAAWTVAEIDGAEFGVKIAA